MEFRPAKISAVEVGVGQVAPTPPSGIASHAERHLTKVGVSEIGVREDARRQSSAAKRRASEVGPREVASGEGGATEGRMAEARAAKDVPIEEQLTGEICRRQVGSLEIPTPQGHEPAGNIRTDPGEGPFGADESLGILAEGTVAWGGVSGVLGHVAIVARGVHEVDRSAARRATTHVRQVRPATAQP
jgi:hypothetical protein